MPPEFAKLEIAPAYKRVYDAVEREIISGRLRSGELLPTEATLAQQFGLNRSTIREGIRSLEQSGLVQREGGKRLRVSLPHYQDLASRASRAMIMHQITFRELWETSMALETVTVEYAADRITRPQLQALEKNVGDMERAKGDDEEFIRLDIAFHNILADATNNRALLLAREPVILLFFPAGKAILPRLKTHQRVIDAHRIIATALRDGNRQEAIDWMRRHMADFKRAYAAAGMDMERPVDSSEALAPEGRWSIGA
jgi:DNA-binding FadR family transcriptional regulator